RLQGLGHVRLEAEQVTQAAGLGGVHLGLPHDRRRRPDLRPADLSADLGERETLGRLGVEDPSRAFGALHGAHTTTPESTVVFGSVSDAERAPPAPQQGTCDTRGGLGCLASGSIIFHRLASMTPWMTQGGTGWASGLTAGDMRLPSELVWPRPRACPNSCLAIWPRPPVLAGARAPWIVISTLLITPRRVKLVTACPSVRPSAGMNRMAMSAAW